MIKIFWRNDQMEQEDSNLLRKKVCLLGDACVGKTSLIKRFVFNEFDEKYISTLGTNVSKRDMKVVYTDKNNQVMDYDLTLAIWDIIGQKNLHSFNYNYFRNANGALVVCDITRRETLENLDLWTSSLFNIAGEIPLVFIINKFDLRDDAAFKIDELKPIAERFNADCFFTSARTGENVERAFYALSEQLVVRTKHRGVYEPATAKKIASEIIMEFCNNVGGLERGIPLVKEIFKIAGVDLLNPTKEQLTIAIPDLQQLLLDLEGAEIADRVAERFNNLILKLNN